MKKMLTSVLTVVIYLCLSSLTAAGQSVALDAVVSAPLPPKLAFASLEPININEARKMVKNYAKRDLKKDKGGYVSLDPEDLALIAQQKDIVKVRFVQAAYLDSEGEDWKKGRPITLILIERNAGARSFEYYKSRAICPPPESACDAEAL
ncbi:MAG TPA: hypothetical protein VGB56_13475 [Flavisolibacter sp.]